MTTYKLDGHEAVPVTDIVEWAQWFETNDCTVARDEINGAQVSTVFLGVNHAWRAHDERPVLFETMVFGGELDKEQDRYTTWAEAERGHAAMVARVTALPAEVAT